MHTEHTEGAKKIAKEIALITDEISKYQSSDGSFNDNLDLAKVKLGQIAKLIGDIGDVLDLKDYAQCIIKDIKSWVEEGLSSTPDFLRTRNGFAVPGDKQLTFFFGPYLLANASSKRSHRLEFFLTFRDDPDISEYIQNAYPHPRNICLSTRLIAASDGFIRGNCVVFFPENIKSKTGLTDQEYALFFFNKFRNIYLDITIPTVDKILGKNNHLFEGDGWLSTNLAPQAFYEARCVWGYFHDYYHHLGPKPFNKFIKLKINWYAGLLEELKVDSQTVLCLLDDETIPYRKAVIEFVILDRAFRYPQQPDAESNFDSGTGVFLLEWLERKGALKFDTETGKGTMSWPLVMDSLRTLVDQITALEELDDKLYLDECKKFVQDVIGPGSDTKRYTLSDKYKNLFKNVEKKDIDFSEEEMY